MDALSAAVPMKVDLDLQLTLMACTLFRRFINASTNIRITETEIVVTLGRRANNPLILAAGTAERREPTPWLGNRLLVIRFV